MAANEAHDSKTSNEEIAEILSYLPDLSGKNVLELGDGEGRFTRHLAAKARHIDRVDFAGENISKLNQKHLEDLSNVSFRIADIRSFSLDGEKYDLVFTNGLFTYLDETTARGIFEGILNSLQLGGSFCFAEWCFSAPGDDKTRKNEAFYRLPDVYNSLFQSVSKETEDGSGVYSYEIVRSKSVETFIKHKATCNYIFWLLTKVHAAKSEAHGYKTFQEFLDTKQYSRMGILRYERIFGDNFISTGGIETTEEFVRRLRLKPKEHVLDVGSGIGGGDFYMAKEYDVLVTGIDLSSNMVSIALERANRFQDIRVQFEVCDATRRNYPAGSFDVVYSRDTILHIKDKHHLFSSFFKWLKPGGRLLISDYCCSEGEWSDDFKKYVQQRGYYLLSVKDYGKVLEDVGFVNVKAEDRTGQFVKMLEKELKRIENIKDDFIKEFSEADHNYLVEGWRDKLLRTRGDGNQAWGLFYGEKPL